MSGVLHPVGPEPARVYWGRRAVVVGLFLVLVSLIVTAVVNATGGPRTVSAAPPAASTAATPSRSVSPSSSASPSATAARPTPSATGSPSASRPVTSPTPARKARSTAPAPARLAACAPAQLRTTLTGKKRLKAGEDTTFSVSVINGSPAPCQLSIAPTTFELKIYSGTDRIWSSDDCSTAVKPISAGVASEKSVGWTMSWNGRRSAKDCKNRAEIPRAGTYFATAQLSGAQPVQLRMILG